MRLNIEIYLDNSAFGETDKDRADEVAAILNTVLGHIVWEDTLVPRALYDSNGNTVGALTITG